MEFLDDCLQEHINRFVDQTRKFQEVVRVALEMFDALEKFHNTQRLHRDIKPKNFRMKNGKVYLIDFGTSIEYILKD